MVTLSWQTLQDCRGHILIRLYQRLARSTKTRSTLKPTFEHKKMLRSSRLARGTSAEAFLSIRMKRKKKGAQKQIGRLRPQWSGLSMGTLSLYGITRKALPCAAGGCARCSPCGSRHPPAGSPGKGMSRSSRSSRPSRSWRSRRSVP